MSSKIEAGVRTVQSPNELEAWRNELGDAETGGATIRVCSGTACAANGAAALYELFVTATQNRHSDATDGETKDKPIDIEATAVGCHGLCSEGPIVTVQPGNLLYCNVTPDDVEEIVRETATDGVVERLLYQNPETEKTYKTQNDLPFYSNQTRHILADVGTIDPESITDYLRSGGFAALIKTLTKMSPKDLISEVEKAGLRGRSGGGLATAEKWRTCRDANRDARSDAHGDTQRNDQSDSYIICNGDESDPDAAMNRAIMEGNPFLIIEGMTLGAYAVGAARGYLYLRNEYSVSYDRLSRAVSIARESGLLGENILGSGFSFEITLFPGGDAFVCGESTALLESLEGNPPVPRAQYIGIHESGLNGKPTVINNVETLANIPRIVMHGGSGFASNGTGISRGTKVVNLSGDVKNTGIIEIPMGTPLRLLVEEIGGGTSGRDVKAVHIGGPLGGCVPESKLDTLLDFEPLVDAGAAMGTGGVRVLDEDTCMVGFARETLEFLKGESCGKCTACREGIAQMHRILDRITSNAGAQNDIDALEYLSGLIAETALCDLGKKAPNIVGSTIRYFRDEYEKHIEDKECPAKACKGMFLYRIVPDACTGCGICLKNCPVDAITGERRKPHLIDDDACTTCGTCFEKCRFDAIIKV
jgi:NADH-quinone oxidoreductase subunit F